MVTENMVFLAQKGEDLGRDNLVDLFCGFGGSGSGLLESARAAGRDVRGTFVNHWDKAIAIHTANHPEHRHFKEDLFLLDPASIFEAGTYCSLLWASPQCTHFSIARGGACVSEQARSHAFSLVKWIQHLNPEGVICENVKEFLSFGPVFQKRKNGELVWALKNREMGTVKRPMPSEHLRRAGESEEAWSARMELAGYAPFMVPDKSRAGEYFDAWKNEMEGCGYEFQYRLIKSANFGDPTIRTRLFMYFVRIGCGKRIVWPNQTHGEIGSDGLVKGGLRRWRTARDIIQWEIKGKSIFSRKKGLARNTLRRQAVGLVKFGLRDFLVPNFSERKGQEPRTNSIDAPVPTVTSHGAGGLVSPEAFLLPSNKGWTDGSVRGADKPLATLTAKSRAEGLVCPETFVLPKDQGWKADYVRSVDTPLGTVQTTAVDHIVTPAIVQLKGKSTAQDIDAPLTAITSQRGHYLMEPMLDHVRGTGRVQGIDQPVHAVCAGGQHQALGLAFMVAIDQTGGEKQHHGTYSADEPVRTIVTKANASCIEVELVKMEAKFLEECSARGVDTTRAATFLGFLVDELKKKGRVDAKPWIYVYHSSGSEGASIDSPLPTVSTKKGTAICYPVIELDGQMLKIDLFYRMLTTLELQRAMGFPDDVKWAGATQEEIVKAIGNSVSRGVARALGLAWYTQDPDVGKYINYEENT